METRIQKALDNHHKGYNCSQSVACAYADLVGIDEQTMFKIMEGFGLGMGGMRGTCGALSGAIAVAGMKLSGGDLDGPYTKAATYKIAKQIVEEFRIKNQSCVCLDIKGVETGTILRSCDGCIEDAAAILEEIVFKG
ncbi:MAG: C-GCAxxG-C-C family protein [Sphaerochaetaceae bacterium]|nr:C-GCAxxG-C-C family protein [Sphaerochaetaceae bacterium]